MRKFLAFSLFGLTSTLSSWASTHLILVRHGETEWNKEHKMQGHSDVPLNDTGTNQAKLFADQIVKVYPHIDAIYSSDLQRAYQTAKITADKYDQPVHQRSRLREICWGQLEGKFTHDPLVSECDEKAQEAKALHPNRKDRWNFPLAPGAENSNQLLTRFQEELLTIARDHPDQTVLVFSHGKAITTFLTDLLNDDEYETIKLSNCARVHISIDEKKAEQPIVFHKIETLGE